MDRDGRKLETDRNADGTVGFAAVNEDDRTAYIGKMW